MGKAEFYGKQGIKSNIFAGQIILFGTFVFNALNDSIFKMSRSHIVSNKNRDFIQQIRF